MALPNGEGRMFVGLVADQSGLDRILRRMAGCDGEPRDEMTRSVSAPTGAYFVLPAIDDFTRRT